VNIGKNFSNASDITGTGSLIVDRRISNTGSLFGCTLSGADCCGDPYCTLEQRGPLPVELVSFKAINEDRAVGLEWTTASEVTNDYFTVERSKDGNLFEVIGTVQGAGNSSWMIDYYMMDNEPLEGVSYYRLKQTDFDGDHEYSEMIPVYCSLHSSSTSISVFPNPTTTNEINLIVDYASEELQLEIVNVSGKIVLEQTLHRVKANSRHRMKFSNDIPKGLYFLRARSTSMIEQRTFIVQ
jgi:hypothetical protein